MSIVTTVLEKFEVFRAVRVQVSAWTHQLKLSESRFSMALGGRTTWSSPVASSDFQRDVLARRAIDESLGRLPIVR